MNNRLTGTISLVLIGSALVLAECARKHRNPCRDGQGQECTGGSSGSSYYGHGGHGSTYIPHGYYSSGRSWGGRSSFPGGSVRGGFGSTGRSVSS